MKKMSLIHSILYTAKKKREKKKIEIYVVNGVHVIYISFFFFFFFFFFRNIMFIRLFMFCNLIMLYDLLYNCMYVEYMNVCIIEKKK